MSEEVLKEAFGGGDGASGSGTEESVSESAGGEERPFVGAEFLSGLGGGGEKASSTREAKPDAETKKTLNRYFNRGKGVLLLALFITLAFAMAGGVGYWWFAVKRNVPKAPSRLTAERQPLQSSQIASGATEIERLGAAKATNNSKNERRNGRADIRRVPKRTGISSSNATGNGKTGEPGRVAFAGSRPVLPVAVFGMIEKDFKLPEGSLGNARDVRLTRPLDRLFLSWAAEKRLREEIKRRQREEQARKRSCEEEIRRRLAQVIIQNPKPLKRERPKPKVKLRPIAVFGVACVGNNCKAFTDRGVLKVGDQLAEGEEVIHIEPNRVVTTYRVIEF
ncbi:hypothetical protein [Thermosulfurimonas sp. F29]|uniref:hypothetical protein n=1 Tax=Thermosulfurimonas sp. F29 TaxID=2867247 RepID=UPI001C829C31|nr:hypothetical protein [Thermosulfurimonas sp. F29]MBX6424112.1 hypothetical protein [Thermosulfurimonas sp. F29]